MTHKAQFLVEWGANNPEYFDHQLDLNWRWKRSGESFPMERGVHSSLALSGNGVTLDLCCGDGFYSNYFYSKKSLSVKAIDFDKQAIRWARKNSSSANVDYIVGDIRWDIPDGPFDNIVWDAAVAHFTESEINDLMARIKAVLKPGGILSGYSIVEAGNGNKHLQQHEYEFRDKSDLARFFSPHFSKIEVYETKSVSRTNLYFYATDGDLPRDSSSHLLIRK